MIREVIFVAAFEAFEQKATPNVPSWVPPLRKAALSRFAEVGLPHRKQEEWRFTDVRPLGETIFRLAEANESVVTAEEIAEYRLGGIQLVFVNGHYAPALSALGELPKGVKIGSLAEALATEPVLVDSHLARHAKVEATPFVALNTAYLSEGALVSLARNSVLEQPLHLLFVSTEGVEPTVSHPRVLITAGENSQATIVESYVGLGNAVYFTNTVTEVVLEANAVIDHYKVNRESQSAYHIGLMQVQLARNSNFSSHSITLGGAIVRNEVNAVLNGEHGECTLNGVYLANGRRLIDNHTAIDHAMPHCNSHEVYKGILADKSRGVFNGKIFVREDAQKTDAKQTNQTLLLSKEAQIDTKPQLEIFADDVRCTHGATIGQLNEEAIFYLRSRGIAEKEARDILTYAFANDIITRIQVEPLREQLEQVLLEQLAGPGKEA